jgi:xanthine dehydrogenase accessory factor
VGLALGFSVVAVDDLEELASPDRFPGARLVTSFDPRVWGVPFDEGAYIVVATRDHAVDQEVLEGLARLNARPAYLGVIGSQGKLLKFKKRLEHRGVDSAWIARIRGPIGVDVGAETPAEIAVAVAAELIAVRRRGQDTRVR